MRPKWAKTTLLDAVGGTGWGHRTAWCPWPNAESLSLPESEVPGSSLESNWARRWRYSMRLSCLIIPDRALNLTLNSQVGVVSGLPMDRCQLRPIRKVFLVVRTWRRFRRHFKSMPRLQWMVLWAIGLVPVLLLPAVPSSVTVGPFDLPIMYLAYGLWIILVLFLVPKAFREDKSRAEQSIDLKLEGPTKDIQRLQDELEQAKTDLQEQKEQSAEMDRVMRIGFAEAGVTLPPRKSRGRASFTFGVPHVSATGTSSGGSRLARWVKRPVRRFWKWFWG